MTQKTISRVLLAGGIIALIGILVVFGLYVPVFAGECKTMYPELERLYIPGLIGLEMIGVCFLLGLVEYFRVCLNIGKNRSFCAENVKSLTRIAVYMAVFGLLWIACAFVPGLIYHADIGPIALMFLMLAMAGFALSLLAFGLGKLLNRAVEIKQENDLTV